MPLKGPQNPQNVIFNLSVPNTGYNDLVSEEYQGKTAPMARDVMMSAGGGGMYPPSRQLGKTA